MYTCTCRILQVMGTTVSGRKGKEWGGKRVEEEEEEEKGKGGRERSGRHEGRKGGRIGEEDGNDKINRRGRGGGGHSVSLMLKQPSTTMDHEGPSMSVIIYIDHQLTQSSMFTSIPGVERRRSIQVV